MLQALYDGEPPLDAYPSSDRGRIAEQQQKIRERVPPGSKGQDRA